MSESEKKEFIDRDLYDALKWLFIGAVAWDAACKQPERHGRLWTLGMSTCFVQARALYEFFFGVARKGDDARARDFAPGWSEPESFLYVKYMSSGKPANKRLFHLVYDRSIYANGPGHTGPHHIKNQAINFANDLARPTKVFAGQVEPAFGSSVESALYRALEDAQLAADYYGTGNPILGPAL